MRTVLLFCALLLAGNAKAQTSGCGRLYVDSAITTSGNGSSWAMAFKTVSEALDSANRGSCNSREIWVAKGTYYPMAGVSIASSRDSSFRILRNGIKLYGGFAGGETSLSARNVVNNPTILTGNLGGNGNSYHVVTVVSNNTIDSNTRLDGFTIKEGYANTVGTFSVAGKVINRSAGGGMHIRTSAPTVTNCTFSLNTGNNGGGMYNDSSSARITNCNFSFNACASNTTISYGGGMYNRVCSPIITDCTFSSNGCNSLVVVTYGGGMYNTASSPSITNCTFSSNTNNIGAGMCNEASSSPTLTNCTFSSNIGRTNGGAMSNNYASPTITNCTFTSNTSSGGGGIYNALSSATITNCIFASNTTYTNTSGGGGVSTLHSSTTIANCIFAFNTVPSGSAGGIGIGGSGSHTITNCTFFSNSSGSNSGSDGGGIYHGSGSSLSVTNCILWNNTSINPNADLYTASPATVNVTYSNTQTPKPGTGNSIAFPFFVNPANPIGPDGIWGTADDGLRLLTCSPAINTGSNAAIPAGITTDITGAVRIQNTTVDKGAYEMPYNSIGGSITTIVASVANPLCPTTSITFTATTFVPGPVPAYQWKKNGVNVGSNGTTYTSNSWADGDSVWVVHTNSSCSIDDSSEKIIVQLVPVPAQPGTIAGNNNPCPGTQTYSVSAVPGATSYTWSVPAGWSVISGQGTTSIAVTSTGASGNVTVTANNSCGVASVARTLVATPLTAPAVPTGPASVCASSVGNVYSVPAVFGATGYSWSVPSGWVITAGQGTAVITVTAAAGNTSGNISVTASNSCQTSSAASVAVTSGIVTPAVAVGSNSGTSVCAGTSVIFTAVPTNGGTAPVYQWRKNGVSVGTNSATYTTVLVAGDNITVTMTSSIACASPASITASGPAVGILPTVVPSVSINGPSQTAFCIGTTTTFTTSSSGGGPVPGYQWYKNGVAIGGATGAGYTGSNFATGDSVSVVLTSNAACRSVDTVRSAVVRLTVYPYGPPSLIVGSNSGNSVCAGSVVVFTATPINGGTAPAYQWKKNGLNVGTNSPLYSTSALANGDVVTATLTSNSPCATVPTVTAAGPPIAVVPFVTPAVTINGAAGIILCAGTSHTFTSGSTAGGPAPMYQWYKNGVAIAGATGATYTSANFANNDAISVRLTSNAACRSVDTAGSNSVVVTVIPNVVPVVTVTANPGTSVPAGASVTFTANIPAGGNNATYQWYKNGVAIAGATSSSYTNNTLQGGDLIWVQVAGLGPCATPNVLTSATLRITRPAGIQTVSGSGNWPESLSLHPNPNTGLFMITADWGTLSAGEKVQVEVVNNLGQSVFRKEVVLTAGKWSLEVQLNEGVANGLYMLRLQRERDGSSMAKPVLIQR